MVLYNPKTKYCVFSDIPAVFLAARTTIFSQTMMLLNPKQVFFVPKHKADNINCIVAREKLKNILEHLGKIIL